MRFAITLTVDATGSGRSLLDWLDYMLLDESRADVNRAIADGRVMVDGSVASDPNLQLTVGLDVKFTEAATHEQP